MSEKKIYRDPEAAIEFSADLLTDFKESQEIDGQQEVYEQYLVTQDQSLKRKVENYQNHVLSGNYVNINGEDLQIKEDESRKEETKE